MRRVIRKYDDFVKSKSINEDVDPVVTPEFSEIENEEGFESTQDNEKQDSSNIIDSEEDVTFSEGDEEEESGEYEGTKKMRKLASELGVEVTNNEIDYKGHKIHYYSETENFHIGKNKFEKPEEVIEFLNNEEEITESARFKKKIK